MCGIARAGPQALAVCPQARPLSPALLRSLSCSCTSIQLYDLPTHPTGHLCATVSKFEKEIGSGRAVASNIKGVLSLAADLMEKKNPKVSHRVIVFTNDSVPATEGQAM